MNETLSHRIGVRIKSRREQLSLTQDDLAEQMGFNHRQTLGAIETGDRKIQPTELVDAAAALGVAIDYFTDPYSAAGEASFSFRAECAEDGSLREFEQRAGCWLATYRELAKPPLLRQSLSLTARDSYEQAQEAGGQTRRRLRLGKFPAFELQDAVEREWGVLVLHIDPPEGVSGAASRLHGVQAILINRNEPSGRRSYDLAHELFHLLTWDTMSPARADSARTSKRGRRVEELANNFAAALLMPRESVGESWRDHEARTLVDRIRAMATDFGVTGPAMKWRLHNLGMVTKAELPADPEIGSAVNARGASRPLLFSSTFVARVHRAVEEGALSVRKATRILGLDTAGLADLFRSYGRQLSYEL